jgi:PAS domain S-box-containing protein
MSDEENNIHRSPEQPHTEPVSDATNAEIYQRLVREVRDYAIFMLDTDGFVKTWNAGAERLKGYMPDEIIGQHFSQFYSSEDIHAQKPQRELQTALADGRVEDEGWRIRKDGSRFWANVVITAIYDESGKHVGFAKVTRDVTDRRAAEEALRAERAELEKRVDNRTAALAAANRELALANEELAKASRMKDQFLAVLSHELRTPLTAIYGWLTLLQAGRVKESQVTATLQIIERNVRAQTQLIDDLLNVSRIITGNLKIAPQWTNALTVIHSAVDSARPAALAKEIDIVVEADDSELIFADPDRLQQVVWNLLTNAVKFTGRHGEIRVELGRIGSKFQIIVSDTGEGITPEFLPYIFDRFSQADTSTKRKVGGLGLGLSIVRHIVEMHGGTVIAHSEGLGRGASMIIQLPLPAIHQAAKSTMSEEKARSLHGVKVMVVEDEPDTREMLEQALQSYGASVVAAASAAEALEQIVQEKPDLLLSDIGLPNMDGYELLTKIRSELPEESRDIPAVALSAFASIEHREKSKLAGYQAHVAKPVAVPDLISILARVVRDG